MSNSYFDENRVPIGVDNPYSRAAGPSNYRRMRNQSMAFRCTVAGMIAVVVIGIIALVLLALA